MNSKIEEITAELKKQSRPDAIAHMAKFGINVKASFGVAIPELRRMAKKFGRDHKLALELWDTGIHDARILASMVDEIDKVTKSQMDKWAKDFNSWDVCDQCCNNLFAFTVYSHEKALDWSKSKVEFVKRAGFVLMAVQAVHDKEHGLDKFCGYLDIVKREANDNRNFVKKAVNWALRQIGKRSFELNKLALAKAEEIYNLDSKTAKWIAVDAIKELKSETAKHRITSSEKKWKK